MAGAASHHTNGELGGCCSKLCLLLPLDQVCVVTSALPHCASVLVPPRAGTTASTLQIVNAGETSFESAGFALLSNARRSSLASQFRASCAVTVPFTGALLEQPPTPLLCLVPTGAAHAPPVAFHAQQRPLAGARPGVEAVLGGQHLAQWLGRWVVWAACLA